MGNFDIIFGWSTLSIRPPSADVCNVQHGNEHHSTYGTQHPLITNNPFARTSVRRVPTAITLFPLSTTLSLEHCTSSCHTFPLRRALGFVYVSTRNTIMDGIIFMYVCYRRLPFRLATPPGFHVTRIPKGTLVICTAVFSYTMAVINTVHSYTISQIVTACTLFCTVDTEQAQAQVGNNACVSRMILL